MKQATKLLAIPLLLTAAAVAVPADPPVRDKTLVVWATPANLTQRGGSALTLDAGGGNFDGIVFGEITPGKWMPGSEGWRRTQKEQTNWPDETADGKTPVQMAITYQDRQVTVYRNGRQYAQYTMANAALECGPQSTVVMGMRHLAQGDNARFAGTIDDARIYDRALTAEQIAALKPNLASAIKPWAWWTFDDKAAKERTGRFETTSLVGGARVKDGKLVLDGKRAWLSTAKVIDVDESFHYYPAKGNLGDTIPFYHKGEYHVFHLVWGVGKTSWEHIVSTDLVHWKALPTALVSDGAADGPDGENMFTGCVIENAGVFHIYYTGFNPRNPQGREWIMHATSTDLVKWTKHPEHGFRADGIHYFNRDFRDPYVFWNDQDKAWWMILNTTDAKTDVAGVGLIRSEDLIHWQQLPPLVLDPQLPKGEGGTPECVDLFHSGDYWYLLYTRNGQNIRRSKDIRGPYVPCEPFGLDGGICGKRLFDGKRHLYFGVLAGVMNQPRELFAGPEGELCQRPVAESSAAFNKTMFQLGKPRDVAAGFTLQTPNNYMFLCSVQLDPQATLSINMREQSTPGNAFTLSLNPKNQEISLNGGGRHCKFDAGKPIKVQAFVQGTVLECFINDQFAFSCRDGRYAEGALSFIVKGGNAKVLKLAVKTLAGDSGDANASGTDKAETLQLKDNALNVCVPNLFGNDMVLQRDIVVPVWGTAAPGGTITVKIGDVQASAKADAQGKWLLKLPAMKANAKPQDMTIRGEHNTLTLGNVLVGDVWLCSGQSNMEMRFHEVNAPQDIAAADFPTLRQLKFGECSASQPGDEVRGRWEACSPGNAGNFTAAGFYFARRIQQETGVPIGLINDSWGGTRIEPWTPPCGFALEPALAQMLTDMQNREQAYRNDLSNSLDALTRWVADAKSALATPDDRLPSPPQIPNDPRSNRDLPTTLYNGMIHPIVPCAIKGAIWYQGEANGGEGDEYFSKMRALIGGWREVWKQGDFPFYFVQLANFEQPNDDPAGGNGWARVRMAQAKSLQIPHTGMAVIIDIGDAGNIHPSNKYDVGGRLACLALHHDYGKQDLIASGPLYKSMTVDNGRIVVSFNSTGRGLMVGTKDGRNPALEDKNGKLKRFAIAGDDRKWVWADARIDGATVVVSSPQVAKPVAVRYAYSMNPAGCNLYNKDGLPASPFRTDDW